jgi:hypothetical protein
MLRTSFLTITVLIVLTPPVESQTAMTQNKKPTQGSSATRSAPIAVADHEVGGVEVALLEVKRTSGDSITIRYRYTNNTTEKKRLSHGGDGLYAWRFAHDAYFIVPTTKLKYTPLKDENGYPVAADHQQFGSGITLAPKQVVNTWTKFPAPAPEVEKITVFVPGAPPFEDVVLGK